MLNKVELIAGTVSILTIATALFLIQVRLDTKPVPTELTVEERSPGIMVLNDHEGQSTLTGNIIDAVDSNNNFSRMIIDDIQEGNGQVATEGDTVLVHYVGSLQNGSEFDNSRSRGEPLEFTLGAGMVIAGWEEGVAGMKEGGERILVVPPEKAYGEKGIGPIPGGATLVFNIELLEVKK